MASVKNSAASGKKQPTVPGANSAAHKKNLAAPKSKTARLALAAAEQGGLSKPGKKSSSASPAYSSLRSRQMLLEKVKRQIWASLVDINQALIAGAKTGNPATAKALFDLAGVYSLPETESKAKALVVPVEMAAEPPAKQAMEPADSADIDPVDAFFCSIGMAPSAEGDQPAESSWE